MAVATQTFGEIFVHDIIQNLDIDNKLALDIGANHGYYSRLIAAKGATVFAFEPNLKNYNKMIQECKESKNIIFENLAVGDTNGKMPLYLCPHNDGGHSLSQSLFQEDYGHTKENAEMVQVIKLDEYFEGVETPISFMKIDVEGAEEQVLRGAENILKNGFLVIALETHKTINCDSIYQFMTSLGYKFYVKGFNSYDNPYLVNVQEIYTDVHYLVSNMKVEPGVK